MSTQTFAIPNDRHKELRRILEERRSEIAGEVQHKIRSVRTEASQTAKRRSRDEPAQVPRNAATQSDDQRHAVDGGVASKQLVQQS